MKKILCAERHDWKQTAESLGFLFHTIDDEPYWDESAYYQFTLKQIENDLEDPTTELHDMCMDLVARVVQSEELRPVMIGLQYFFQMNTSWGQVMAYSSLITIPVVALFLAFQRSFINSIASSGVKG